MKRRIIGLILVAGTVAGCQTAPPPVDDAFLVEKTSAQTDTIKKLEASIIEKKNAQDKADLNERIASQWISVAAKDTAVSDSILQLLQEKEKLYNIAASASRQEKVRKDIVDLVKRREQMAVHSAFRDAAQRSAQSELELRRAELAVVVAQLQLEKARIASDYQTKRQTAATSRIDAARYAEFVGKTEKDLKEAQERHRLNLEETKKAKDRVDACGLPLEEVQDAKDKQGN